LQRSHQENDIKTTPSSQDGQQKLQPSGMVLEVLTGLVGKTEALAKLAAQTGRVTRGGVKSLCVWRAACRPALLALAARARELRGSQLAHSLQHRRARRRFRQTNRQ
jgi:hypothetical protein